MTFPFCGSGGGDPVTMDRASSAMRSDRRRSAPPVDSISPTMSWRMIPVVRLCTAADHAARTGTVGARRGLRRGRSGRTASPKSA